MKEFSSIGLIWANKVVFGLAGGVLQTGGGVIMGISLSLSRVSGVSSMSSRVLSTKSGVSGTLNEVSGIISTT